MHLCDFDYELPERLIAAHPPARRTDSRLLVVDSDADRLVDASFANVSRYLRAGDLLVLNDTRVVKARLLGRKASGGRVEALIERVLTEDTALAHVRASKAPRVDTELEFADNCRATVLGRQKNLFELRFDGPVVRAMEAHGHVPLPPYIDRPAEALDDERYQTVYARHPGAVAAPTAGLHFDLPLLDRLRGQGVEHCFVTLHVGAGTFQTLKAEAVDDNHLHAERIEVPAATAERIQAARAAGGRIVAVGTTCVRTLEAATRGREVQAYSGETSLFIKPGYRFQSVDILLTNFHLPRSSLLMLVAAFAGRERMLDAYRHAVERDYRFFSYGDAMLLLPPGGTP